MFVGQCVTFKSCLHFIFCYINNLRIFYYITMQSYVTYASDNDGEYEHFYCHYLFNMY